MLRVQRFRGAVISVVALLLVTGAACNSSNGGDEASRGSSTSSGRGTSTTGEATTTSAAGAATSTTKACGFLGGLEERTANPSGDPIYLANVTADVVDAGCHEQVAFLFEGKGGAPGYDVRLDRPPFKDEGDHTIAVAGEAFVHVTMQNVSVVDLSGETPRETYTGPQSIRPGGASLIREIRHISDFEAVSDWVIGLDAEHPFTVQVAASGDRLLVDVGAPTSTD